MPRITQCLIVATIFCLAACSGSDSGGDASQAVSAASLQPTDTALAELYNRSCRSCHAQGAAQAPLTGDVDAWQPRLVQGMDALLDHTLNGYQGMPSMGYCFDCTEDQFRALIRFMSSGEG